MISLHLLKERINQVFLKEKEDMDIVLENQHLVAEKLLKDECLKVEHN